MTGIDGETKLIGFLGSTYRTSKMYAMYNAAIEVLGLNFRYVPFVVDDLEQAVNGLRHLGIAAVGVTIPYKIDIIPFLDELDADARRIGAVNVVVNRDGRLIGGNTDGRGARRALAEQMPDLHGRRIVLLGAGGAARAIAFALHDAGARLTILNHTPAGAAGLAADVGGGAAAGGFDRLPELLPRSEILINTTPVGMAGTAAAGQSPVPTRLLHPGLLVMDIVAKPPVTALLQAALDRGCPVVYGSRMLLWQGVEKFHLYTGVEPPIAVMEAAMEEGKRG